MAGDHGHLSVLLWKRRMDPCGTQQPLYPPDRSGVDLPSDLSLNAIRSESAMKPTAIVYTSGTGHTRQYALLLAEQLGLPVYTLEEAAAQLLI